MTISIYVGFRIGNRPLIAYGLFFLVLFIMSNIYSSMLLKKIFLKREHYPRCFEGNDVAIDIKIETESTIPAFMLEITDIFPPGHEYKTHHLLPFIFNRNNQYQIQYRGNCSRRRGLYILGPIKLSCADPLGIFPRSVELEEFTRLLVYPQAVDLRYFQVLWKGTLLHVGLETLLTSGRSEEFIGLRDYQRGDSPNLIHWRSTARHQKLLVKDFKENVQTEVSIFLDLYRLSLSGLGDVTTVEYIIKAGATVARISIELGHFVQVFALCEEIEHIPLGGGTAHLINVLDRMTFFKAKGEGSFEDAFKQQSYLCKNGSTVVLIAAGTNFSHSNLKNTLRELISRKIRVIVILIDDRTFIKLWKEQEMLHVTAAPIDEIAKLLILDGCAVFVIGKDDKLEEKLGLPVETIETVTTKYF